MMMVDANTRWTPRCFSHRQCNEIYWVMQCACGTERIVSLRNYRTGKSISCGCYRREVSRNKLGRARLPIGEAARNQLVAAYRQGAKRRGIEFELDHNEFAALTSSDCHYCGSPPMNTLNISARGANGAYVYNGIDRMDNSTGYTLNNCVTCCVQCNRAKAVMPYVTFVNWLDRLVQFRTQSK